MSFYTCLYLLYRLPTQLWKHYLFFLQVRGNNSSLQAQALCWKHQSHHRDNLAGGIWACLPTVLLRWDHDGQWNDKMHRCLAGWCRLKAPAHVREMRKLLIHANIKQEIHLISKLLATGRAGRVEPHSRGIWVWGRQSKLSFSQLWKKLQVITAQGREGWSILPSSENWL